MDDRQTKTTTTTTNKGPHTQQCWRRVQFVSHVIFCECLSASCSLILRNSILKAYAIQKCSQLEMGGGEGTIYDCEAVCDFRVSTHPRLHNNWKIISFKCRLQKKTLREAKRMNLIVDDDDDDDELKTCDTHVSKYTRLIYSTNSYLRKKFPQLSCNDLSDTKFVSRSLEILFENYHLTIDPQKNEYTVQYSRPDRATLEYLEETSTLEANYRGLEGKVYVNPTVIAMRNHVGKESPKRRRRFIGMASFLDSNDLKVKTNYLEYNTTTDAAAADHPDDGGGGGGGGGGRRQRRLSRYDERLVLYQRLCTKSLYSKSQPFVIELSRRKSISGEGKSCRPPLTGGGGGGVGCYYYFETCWRTNARLPPKIVDLYVRLPPNYRPIHHPNIITEKDVFGTGVRDGPISSGGKNVSSSSSSSAAVVGEGMPGSSFGSSVVLLPKLDGILATLIFYETHFVVTHSFRSESFVHNLSAKLYYLLKDYVFLVESDLCEALDREGGTASASASTPAAAAVVAAGGFGPHAEKMMTTMAIIDLQSGDVFDPIQRYHILQKIKGNTAVYSRLLEYNIFINSESLLEVLNPPTARKKGKRDVAAAIIHENDRDKKTFSSSSSDPASSLPVENLNDGEIYEVLINPFTCKVSEVIKARPDKTIPNSGILVKTVCQSLINHHNHHHHHRRQKKMKLFKKRKKNKDSRN